MGSSEISVTAWMVSSTTVGIVFLGRPRLRLAGTDVTEAVSVPSLATLIIPELLGWTPREVARMDLMSMLDRGGEDRSGGLNDRPLTEACDLMFCSKAATRSAFLLAVV